MGLTRAQLRQKLYLRGWGLGFARTATAIPTAQKIITDAVAFTNAAAGDGDYKGFWMYRPGAATANQIREASATNDSGSLSHEGVAYSGDTTVLDYELIGLLHPDELNDSIRRANRLVYFETFVPFSLWTDGDFAGTISSPYDWAANATGTTPTKTATQANNFRGFNSLLLTGAGSVLTDVAYVTPGDVLCHGGAAMGSDGNYLTTYSLLDVDNSNAVLETLNFTSRHFQHFSRRTTIPSGCYRVKAKLETATNSIFDYLFSHIEGIEGRQLQVPSWGSEKWRILGVGPADYGRQVGTRIYNARSQHITQWYEPKDWQLHPFTEEANPYHIQVNRRDGLGDEDYWLHGLRPFSDVSDLTDETTQTEAPEDLIIAACEYVIAETLYRRTEDQKWAVMKQEAGLALAAQRMARPVSEPEHERTVYVPGGRGGASLYWRGDTRF